MRSWSAETAAGCSKAVLLNTKKAMPPAFENGGAILVGSEEAMNWGGRSEADPGVEEALDRGNSR